MIASPLDVLKDGSKELWDLTRQRIIDPGGHYFFSKAICGFVDVSQRAHLPLSLFLEDESRNSKLVEYPRKHLKTTLVTVSFTLWCFAKKAIEGTDLDLRVGIASSTKTNAMRFLRLIKIIPENNPIFQAFIPELIPEFGNEQVWNTEEIIFPRKAQLMEPSVDTIGAGGRATSRHYTMLIEDDLINEENYDSPPAIKRAIELHQLYENLLEKVTDRRIVCENSWQQHDLNYHIVQNEPETAVLSVGSGGGLNTNRSRHLSSAVLDAASRWDGEEAIWPERFNKKALGYLRQKVGPRIYNAQYENQPFDPDVVDFRVEWLRYFEWGSDPKTGEKQILIAPSNGHAAERIPISELYVCAAYDPAMGEKTENARSALVITGVDSKDRVFVLHTLAIRQEPLTVLAKVLVTVKQWNCLAVGVESVLFQRVLFQLLQRYCPKVGLSVGVFRELRPLSGKNKDSRIRYLLSSAFSEGRIYIHKSHGDLIDEYVHFPLGATKDILDALAYTALLWTTGATADDEKRQHELDDMLNDLRNPVTGY